MSLSNKILIGFFGFAFLYLTAVFAEVRLKGIPNIIDDNNSTAESVDLKGVSYIVIEGLKPHVQVVGSDQARLEVRSREGNLLQRLKYRISGDTLVLSELQSEEVRTVRISVFVPKASLKGLSVNGAYATLKGAEQDHLHISQNAGQIWMSDNTIGKIQLDASGNSKLNISATDLDTLSANIDNSHVSMSSAVGVVQGWMKNHSFLRIHDVEEIRFKKDETSRLNLYQ